MLHRMPKRRRRIHRGEHLTPRGLDVRFEPLDVSLPIRVRGFLAVQRLSGRVPIGDRSRSRLAPRVKFDPGRFPPGFEGLNLGLEYLTR